MNTRIQKSVLLIVLLNAGVTSCSEEHKNLRVGNQSVGALTIQISQEGVAPIAERSIEQTACKLAKIIGCFKNPDVKQRAVAFFDSQAPEALQVFNDAAKISLQESLENGRDSQAPEAFTKSVIDGFEQKQVNRCAILQQQHKQNLRDFKRTTCQNQCKCIGLVSFATTMACGIVILTSVASRCDS